MRDSSTTKPPRSANSIGLIEDEEPVRELAQFRYALRKFLRFSENVARRHGVTPQQHQLILGVAGFTGRGSATISELAEFLQERPHSVVGLIERAVEHGLVRRTQDKSDRRVVNVTLTASGKRILSRLTALHQGEARRIQEVFGARVASVPPARVPRVGLARKSAAPYGGAGRKKTELLKDNSNSRERNTKKAVENK